MSREYQLYGAWPSYFTAKVRAYLQFKRIPYVGHIANADVYAKIIIPRVGMPFIPIVITPDDKALQDSSDIIDYLEARHPDRPIFPKDPVLRLASYLMELYADECLIYPGLHMRWHHPENRDWAVVEFGRNAVWGLAGDARATGEMFAQRIQGYLPLMGFDDPAVREVSRVVFDRLMSKMESLITKQSFLLGEAPTLGDFALMGPTFAHWYRDPVPAKIMRVEYPHVCVWVERLLSGSAVGETDRWTISPAGKEVYKEIGEGFGTFLNDTADALDRFMAQQEKATPISKGGPAYMTRIFDTPVKRTLNTYHAYMLQRVWDVYGQVEEKDRLKVDAFLKEIGCYDFVARSKPNWRVTKNERFKLVLE